MRRALVAGVALAVALTACGGGGVSKPGFVATADAACGASTAAAAAIAKPTNLPDLSAAASAMAAAADGQVAELRKLPAPRDDRALVESVIAGIAGVGSSARSLQDAATKTDDAATARATTDLRTTVTSAGVQAQGYGFGVCGRGLQAPAFTIVEGGHDIVKAAFVARADALCAAANRKVDALTSPTSLATVARFLTAYLPIEEKLFADIRALVAPPGDEGTVAEMLAAQDRVIAKDKELLAAAQARNQGSFNQADHEEAGLITAANATFDAYGLRSCGTLGAF